jgi:hypothetical protein
MSLQVQTPTLQINNIPLDKLQALIERANESGATPEEYALHLIVEGLEARAKTFDEIPAPSPRAVEERGASASPARVVTEWYGRLEDAEPFPDLDYWLAQPDVAKLEAAWEMVLEAHQLKGEDLRESRLQRSVGGLQRRAG